MLTDKEHREFAKLLRTLRKRYPDRSYVEIIYDAKRFSKPWILGTPTDRVALEVLRQYNNKE